MDDFICNECGYTGTPDGSSTCPQCGSNTMMPMDELGKDLEDDMGVGRSGVIPDEPESLEELQDDEFKEEEEDNDSSDEL